MIGNRTFPRLILTSLLLIPLACNDDGGEEADGTGDGDGETGDGDGDTTGDGDGDGDGDTTGDGDGDTAGDGDGDTTGDGDGDTTGDGDGDGGLTCEDIELEYDAAVSVEDCETVDDCKIISGACGVGLGGCWYSVNVSVDEAALADLVQAYSDLDCLGPVCDCPGPPTAACVDGVCVSE